MIQSKPKLMTTEIIFPDIDYKFWYNNYPWNSAKKVYSSINVRQFSDFEGTPLECINLINRLVSINNQSDFDILRVIDLINQWGGKSSRMFYSNNKKNNYVSARQRIMMQDNLQLYKNAITAAKNADPKSFELFSKVYGINKSFSGKHAMFWSGYKLVIVDNKIAGTLGFKNPDKLFKFISYDAILTIFNAIKVEHSFENITQVENSLFAFHSNYFLNDNSGFKKKINLREDFHFAKKIAEKLMIKYTDTPLIPS